MSIENSEISKQNKDLIDPLAFIRSLLKGKKLILRTIIIFSLIGVFFAVFTENQYSTSTVIVPQTDKKSNVGSGLGGLAAMAGVDLGGLSGEAGITPNLYPQILNSVSFQKELLYKPIQFVEGEAKINYVEYYKNIYKPGLIEILKEYTIGLPSLVFNFFRNSNETKQIDPHNKLLFKITKEEKKLMKRLQNQIKLSIYEKEGYIRISSEMPSAIASAEMTQACKDLLQKYIINFKIQKSKAQLDFINERLIEKKKEFYKAQKKRSNYIDKNQNINSQRAKIELEQLQSDYDLAYVVYEELAKQHETQQLQVKQDTPVFTVIQPVLVPLVKSKPDRLFILLGWVFIGLFSSIAFVFFREYILNLFKKIKTNL